ncbi:MAG: hypothetical protein KIG88_06115, partial [Weeksellaceae bacterium]|nr:hypothetical protein [Weeksellaceae bacterium]
INSNINSSTLVIDQFGNIYKNDVENLNGQIMRIPISGFTVSTNTNATQGSLRLDFDKSTISPACIQNGIKICDLNFINTIKGVTANELISNETLTANTGTVPRITDRIKLPKGVYKIQIRLNGNYDNIVETNGNTIVKLAVGNREFSVHNYYDNIVGPNETSIIFTDYINLNQDDFVDFLMDNWNNKKFVITPNVNQGTIPNPNYNPSLPISDNNVLNYNSKIIKSMVLIERIR